MGRLGHTRRLVGRYSKEDRLAAQAAIEQVGLSGEASRSFAKLSGGQRQRTLIARAICAEPELLLLDEPTSHVDSRSESELANLLGKLSEQMSIVMVSHDLGFVSDLVRRVICVNRRVATHPVDRVTGTFYSRTLRLRLKCCAASQTYRFNIGLKCIREKPFSVYSLFFCFSSFWLVLCMIGFMCQATILIRLIFQVSRIYISRR